MKVKIIRGLISIAHGIKFDSNERLEENQKLCERLERKVNDFCKGKEIVSITPSTYVTLRANNGGNDEVQMVYTILYKDVEASK